MTIPLHYILLFARCAAPLAPLLVAFAPRGMPIALGLTALLTIVFARLWPADTKPAKPLLSHNVIVVLGAFLAYAGLSMFWSDSPTALKMTFNLYFVAGCAGITAVAVRYVNPAILNEVLHGIMLGFPIVLALFTINNAYDFPVQRWFGETALTSSILESNIPKRSDNLFALFMWPIGLWLWKHDKKRVSLLFILSVTACALFFTSHTAMLAIMGGLFVLVASLIKVRIGQAVGFILLPLALFIGLLGGIYALNMPQAVQAKLNASGIERLYIWDYTAKQVAANLPFGIGIDGSRVIDDINKNNNDIKNPSNDPLPQHPHNVFLQVWLELGIPGALLLACLGYMMWVRARSVIFPLQPFVWAYITTAVITLGIAYGAWQAWWLSGHALAILMMVHAAKERT